jgi:hypothetical protein
LPNAPDIPPLNVDVAVVLVALKYGAPIRVPDSMPPEKVVVPEFPKRFCPVKRLLSARRVVEANVQVVVEKVKRLPSDLTPSARPAAARYGRESEEVAESDPISAVPAVVVERMAPAARLRIVEVALTVEPPKRVWVNGFAWFLAKVEASMASVMEPAGRETEEEAESEPTVKDPMVEVGAMRPL